MRSISGQVAMTIVAAQMMGTMKTRMIQSDATISVTMNSTLKVVCARSRRMGEPPETVGFMRDVPARVRSSGFGRVHGAAPAARANVSTASLLPRSYSIDGPVGRGLACAPPAVVAPQHGVDLTPVILL